MNNIMDLRVYVEALEFANYIWEVCSHWDWFAKSTTGKQLVAAADSISANIAEGYGRYHYRENLHFCYYARGSFEESLDWIRKAYNRKLINEKQKNKIDFFMESFPKEFNAYINYIKKMMHQSNKQYTKSTDSTSLTD